jgi:hypothetical protein
VRLLPQRLQRRCGYLLLALSSKRLQTFKE